METTLIHRKDDDSKVISISFIHGFIWGDVADIGAKILVYTDAAEDVDGQYAKTISTNLGEKLYQLREQSKLDLISINELQNILMQNKKWPLVVADFSDNPGLGGMGDATFILKTILDTNATHVVFATIFDPSVVEQAFNAGLNKNISIMLGGKFGPLSGESLKKTARVKSLNPELTQTFTNLSLPLGRTAALDINDNIIIVNSLRSQIYSPDAITNMNITLNDKRAIVVKSSEHFRATFSEISTEIVRVSSPGVGNMNIAEIPYKKISRRVWPINQNKECVVIK